MVDLDGVVGMRHLRGIGWRHLPGLLWAEQDEYLACEEGRFRLRQNPTGYQHGPKRLTAELRQKLPVDQQNSNSALNSLAISE